jgi:hypothetical protein
MSLLIGNANAGRPRKPDWQEMLSGMDKTPDELRKQQQQQQQGR